MPDVKLKKLLLVGNPNVGKSVIFGHLTGKYATVSNYHGTTVEVSYGNTTHAGEQYTVVDSPGVNSLLPMSEDEQVTRNILLNEDFDSVLQIADTKNLRRSLVISLQLAEMGVPFSMGLNMADEAKDAGIETDFNKLIELIGVDAVSTIATQRKGMDKLREIATRPRHSTLSMNYSRNIETAIKELESLLPDARISKRSIALMLLGGDRSLRDWLHANIDDATINRISDVVKDANIGLAEPIGYQINRERLLMIDRVVDGCQSRVEKPERGVRRWLGDVTMHPVYGIPFMLLSLYVMYEFVGVFGAGTLVDFMESVVFERYINPYAISFINAVLPSDVLKDIMVGEYGVITMALTYAVAIVLPITGTFFIAFGILEDSGYLPRLAIMLNKVFNIMGLNGKAVLPMVLGLGCSTMATLTTRILDTKKEKLIVTLLLALGIPCSAQLGVIMGMLAGVSFWATVIWVGTVIAVVLLVGFLAGRLMKGDSSDFMMELPPMRMPKLKNIFGKTIRRIEWYVKEAVPLFILGTLFLFAADKMMLLDVIEKIASPVVVTMLGLPEKATEAFLIGFLRRDYGAAGMFALQKQGLLNPVQVVVGLVTITLFVPCIAQFFMAIKERGMKAAVLIVAFVLPFAVLVGAVLNFVLTASGVDLS